MQHPRRRCICDRQRVPRRRARVGGLCGFRGTAERVPTGSPKTRRCATVRERSAELQRRRRNACGQPPAESRAASGEAGEKPGAFLRQSVHFCPQCGQFRGKKRRFSARAKSGLALIFEKSQDCAAVAGTILALFIFGGGERHKNRGKTPPFRLAGRCDMEQGAVPLQAGRMHDAK